MIPFFLVVAIVPFAFAQERHEPTPSQEAARQHRSFFDYGGFTASQALVPRGAASRWTLRAGVGAEYSDNADQNVARNEGGRIDGSFGVGWSRRSPRLESAVDYRLTSDLYQWEGYDRSDRTTQALAGSAGWQATRNFRMDASGTMTQSLLEGFQGSAKGVRTGYGNRTDEYAARASWDWRLGRTTSNRTYYRFRYTNYLDKAAEGEDTRAHEAGTSLEGGVGRRDRVRVSYDYRNEEAVSTDNLRQNHIGGLGWDHTLAGYAGGRPSVVGLSYGLDRGLYRQAPNYWSQNARATYATSLSARTDWTSFGGYHWIKNGEDRVAQGWIAGATVAHRFSPLSEGTLGGRYDYAYEPVSSRTDFTQLTRILEITGSLGSQLSRTTRFDLGGRFTDTNGDGRLGPTDESYWEAGGTADLTGGTPDLAFWGLGYVQTRRQAEQTDDDYHRFEGRAFLRSQLVSWLSGNITYRHTRFYYDRGSTGENYFENLIRLGLEGQW